ncbi:uncharacterized protein (DUF1800 family) [Labrys wisconsinensis]|uniref:Uncharacterized protein (DUF1800 family) n=1 Tax=Labrys wisconsinensis TaxID=425677 RepID=A0ABU0JF06_9HYPH|nr:uncharacterized protein (DUF1800 family) [Labrys wisconsinensis]
MDNLDALAAARVASRAARKLAGPAGRSKAPAADMAGPAPSAADAEVIAAPQKIALGALMGEIDYRYTVAIGSVRPFVERLVLFWSNHFAVSARRSAEVRTGVGGYEREAIRPHVLGRFRDMVGAVANHPTMLGYLDNDLSIGPNSPYGIARKRGLNENFARELMELHTLGVNGGYTQADVTSLAKILTGWRSKSSVGNGAGAFRFDADRHEPGAFTVLGRSYREGGVEQGEAVLDDLARHPATARHIAAKLVRHFVGDSAPPTIAPVVAAAFMKTEGDLAETARALVRHPDAWTAPPAKILPPYDMIVAMSRALGEALPVGKMVLHCRKLGQPIWEPRAPAGFDDGDSTWASPEGISTRLDLAVSYAGASDKNAGDIADLANELYGPALSAQTLTTLRRAESRSQALALLLMSPELMKR